MKRKQKIVIELCIIFDFFHLNTFHYTSPSLLSAFLAQLSDQSKVNENFLKVHSKKCI